MQKKSNRCAFCFGVNIGHTHISNQLNCNIQMKMLFVIGKIVTRKCTTHPYTLMQENRRNILKPFYINYIVVVNHE